MAHKKEQIKPDKAENAFTELAVLFNAYPQRHRALTQTNSLPDIFVILEEKRNFASFVKLGYSNGFIFIEEKGRENNGDYKIF